MKPTTALGRYSAIVAAIVCVGTIAAAIVARLMGKADPFLDMLAFGSFTAVLGTAGALAQLNGTVRRTDEQDAIIAQQGAQLAAQAAELAELRAHVKG